MPSGRVLQLFAAGASDDQATIVGMMLDGLLALMVAHQRSASSAREAFKARFAAMPRLSPALAKVLGGVLPAPGQEPDRVT